MTYHIKRFSLIVAGITSLLLLAPAVSSSASALDIFSGVCGGAGGSATDACKEAEQGRGSSTNPVVTVIKAAISILSVVIGAAAIIGIVVSGLRLIVANGDSGSVSSARSGLLYSLIGLAVAVLAQVIVLFVLDKLAI